jgi:hypothetical protein
MECSFYFCVLISYNFWKGEKDMDKKSFPWKRVTIIFIFTTIFFFSLGYITKNEIGFYLGIVGSIASILSLVLPLLQQKNQKYQDEAKKTTGDIYNKQSSTIFTNGGKAIIDNSVNINNSKSFRRY